MHLLVLAALTAGAGALVSLIAAKRPAKQPIPVRVRVRRPQG